MVEHWPETEKNLSIGAEEPLHIEQQEEKKSENSMEPEKTKGTQENIILISLSDTDPEHGQEGNGNVDATPKSIPIHGYIDTVSGNISMFSLDTNELIDPGEVKGMTMFES